ncbi:hypothetical protein M422DRAFT_33482 [Sphaerobolus stellatus SS14]|uniref:Uncharacterized protein n=1 Tax=Sphaerobolus stellatus (strain SS14) TaxID=990650 RepID=A0A0C9VKU8_SPHS4|nr:hypothetical protein M422DRAFT_33482 [Sphaerobolus stellatus SS14]
MAWLPSGLLELNPFRSPVLRETSLWQATFLNMHLTLASLFLVLHPGLSINYDTSASSI